MKLGAAYIVFDGEELLKSSILQVRDHVDEIIVVYQVRSWFGDSSKSSLLPTLSSLFREGLIDHLIEFRDFQIRQNKNREDILMVKEFERKKRQVGLDKALSLGCTHYLCLDVDEFYDKDEFRKAKNLIIQNGYTATSASFINYVNTPTIHRGYDPNRVPFICKIDKSSKMVKGFFVRCDPTRGISNCLQITHDFDPDVITMHHMETVRRDLTLKYSATTRGIFNRTKTPELVNKISSVSEHTEIFDFDQIIFPGVIQAQLIHCENKFSIPYASWK